MKINHRAVRSAVFVDPISDAKGSLPNIHLRAKGAADSVDDILY